MLVSRDPSEIILICLIVGAQFFLMLKTLDIFVETMVFFSEFFDE